MIVVDTNIISYFYLSNNLSSQVEELQRFDSLWVTPILWRSEFRSVLASYLRKEFLSLDGAQEIMEDALILLQGREYEVASYQVLNLVNQSSCSAYDCEFVALAKDLDIPLITADKTILNEFPESAVSLDTLLT